MVAQDGLYRLDAAGLTALQSADGSGDVDVNDIVVAGDREWLVGAETGLFWLDAALTALRPAGSDETGDILEIADAEDGGWLVGTLTGSTHSTTPDWLHCDLRTAPAALEIIAPGTAGG